MVVILSPLLKMKKFLGHNFIQKKSQKNGLQILKILLISVIKKRLIFTLLFDSGKFVLSRNFSLQHVGDLDWLLRNYDFKNITSHIDELIILNIREKKKNFDKVL